MKSKKYQHLFFDLDRTLWDFDGNSKLTLMEIFANRKLEEKLGVDFDRFHHYYMPYNLKLWELYKQGKIEKTRLSVERFEGTLRHFGLNDTELAAKISHDYITISPTKTKLFQDALEVIEELSKDYSLHILTNGFNEVQFVKIENSGLKPYFRKIITSEMIGIQKPNVEIFNFALNEANALLEGSIMIGDDQETDIMGAKKAGMDQVFVNFHHEDLKTKATYHIHQLKDLLSIF